jgi:hypothetical protein
VSGSVRKLLTPGWVALHLVAWTAAIAMVFLGRWQLDVSNEKHFDLQNFGYAFQWWAFSAATILFWLRAMRDAVRGRPADVSTSGELVLRRGESGLDFAGPVNLVSPARPGQDAIVYRGYRMPQSSQGPVRAQGDAFQSSYNDYLWELALADGATPTVQPPLHSPRPEPTPHPTAQPKAAGELTGND